MALPVLLVGAQGCYLEEFLQSTWFATSGPPRAFIFSQAHYCCRFHANLSIHRLKLILGQADLRVSRVVFSLERLVSEREEGRRPPPSGTKAVLWPSRQPLKHLEEPARSCSTLGFILPIP